MRKLSLGFLFVSIALIALLWYRYDKDEWFVSLDITETEDDR